MKEHLVEINWRLLSQDEYNTGIFDDNYSTFLDLENKDFSLVDDAIKPVLISFKGIGNFMKDYTIESGETWFWGYNVNPKLRHDLIDYINSELNPPLSKRLLTMNKVPQYGMCILVFKIEFYQCNHREDPVEWDCDESYLGILGEQVKLAY